MIASSLNRAPRRRRRVQMQWTSERAGDDVINKMGRFQSYINKD
jgi:hypothetical protein